MTKQDNPKEGKVIKKLWIILTRKGYEIRNSFSLRLSSHESCSQCGKATPKLKLSSQFGCCSEFCFKQADREYLEKLREAKDAKALRAYQQLLRDEDDAALAALHIEAEEKEAWELHRQWKEEEYENSLCTCGHTMGQHSGEYCAECPDDSGCDAEFEEEDEPVQVWHTEPPCGHNSWE